MHADRPVVPRREFLKGTLLTSALSGAALAAAGTAAAAQPAPAAAKAKSSYMKLSLAAYSFNQFLPNSWRGNPSADATMTLKDFIQYCAEQNLEGTELTGYYFPAEVTNDYLMSIKNMTFRLGLDVSGTAIGNDFCVKDPGQLDAELARTRQWIDYAAAMGAPVIRIFAGNIPKDDTFEASVERCAAAINKALEYAAQKGVCLALENHGGITATPEQMFKIIDKVKPSPWFGVNFDGGNFRTDDPYRDLEKIAPLAINAQIKVMMAPNREKEPADLARVVGILKRANYRGYLVLEYEEKDPYGEIPKHLKQLRDLIHG